MADLYLAGPDMLARDIIDNYESLIWTERYQDSGDFVLVVKERPALMRDLRQSQFLRFSESKRVMQIEKIESSAQADGPNMIKMTGRSFETFLSMRSTQRIQKEPLYLEDSPAGIAFFLVDYYCCNPEWVSPQDLIPGLQNGVNYYGGEPRIGITIERKDVYSMVKEICTSEGLGFKIEMLPEGLRFNVYRGTNRANPTTDGLYREYSPDAENLINTSSVESVEKYRNHVRVLGNKDFVDVFAPGVPAGVSGLDRRTMYLEARDIGDDDDTSSREEQLTALATRGRLALAATENSYARLVDGDIPPTDWADGFFNLGDIVVAGDYYGTTATMLISEQIWSLDATGARLIPTFQQI